MLSRNFRTFLLHSTIAGVALPLSFSPALAEQQRPVEEPAADARRSNEIIVTAQKRAENIQDVGVAVTALGAKSLSLINQADPTQIANVVPSMQVQQFSPSVTVYNLRGVSQNDFSDYQEAPIAFYNDEVYVSALGAISGQAFDVERIEVLRGPQGTLFGRNATGGLVQVVTAKPTATWQGFGTVTVGSHSQVSTELGVGGPLTDRVRMRVSGATNYNKGFYHNQFPGGKDGGSSDNYALRAQLEFDVGDTGLLRLKGELLRNDDERTGVNGRAAKFDADGLGVLLPANEDFYGTGPGNTVFGYRYSDDPFVNNINFPGLFNRTYYSLTAKYEQNVSDTITITSITNYQDLDKQLTQDVDASPLSLIEIGIDQKLWQASQELRLAGTADRLKWVTGLYGLKIKTNVIGDNIIVPAVPAWENGLPYFAFASNPGYVAPQNTETLAAFAQMDYRLSDVFTVVLGGRYSIDWKKFGFNAFIDGAPVYDFRARRPDLASQRFKNWSGKLQLEARPNDDTLVYAGLNRGTKSGGFNAPRVIPTIAFFAQNPASPTPADLAALDGALAGVDAAMVFGQEVLTNYEAGFKLTLADRTVTLNGAMFHYDYDGYQSFQNNNANTLIFNRPAKLTGVELDFTARPISQVTISGFATHMLKRSVKGVILPSGRVTGRVMPQVPKWSIGGAAAIDVPIADLGKLTLATNWKYDSAQFLSVFNAPVDHEKGRAIGNVRASFAPGSGGWEVAFFVNNVTDKTYRIFASDNASFISVVEDTWARPRWIGGSLTYRFGQ